MKGFFIRSLAILGTLGLASLASADDIRSSRWDSTYRALNGKDITATVTFDGRSGKYVNEYGQTGEFSNVRYGVSGGGLNGAARGTKISGRWRFQSGHAGNFSFDVSADGRDFRGGWCLDGGNAAMYSWTGSRAAPPGDDWDDGTAPDDSRGDPGDDPNDSFGDEGKDDGDGLEGLLTEGTWASTDGGVRSADFGSDGRMTLQNRKGMVGLLKWKPAADGRSIMIRTQSGRTVTWPIRKLGRNRVQIKTPKGWQTLVRSRR